ncbi:MAG TPA: class I SAM-dependent methyltransferase [Candidatus Dormibacteraeota bacterium]|nr:class I SAM-dependent methyltransferase [Candidatus Dormibacteraeota bacterium]
MSVERFQKAAATYEQWFETRRGRHSALAEHRLIEWLLSPFSSVRTLLEVGCGTGHFTGLLAESGFDVLGVDLAPAMIAQAKHRLPALPFVVADAHRLPFRARSFDVAVYITTIEFLDQPLTALQEGVRVARRGLVAIALNRCSLGGLSRRWGRDRRGRLVGAAHDFSPKALRRLMQAAAGPRLGPVRWSSTLFPDGFYAVRTRLPLGGDVIGICLELRAR